MVVEVLHWRFNLKGNKRRSWTESSVCENSCVVSSAALEKFQQVWEYYHDNSPIGHLGEKTIHIFVTYLLCLYTTIIICSRGLYLFFSHDAYVMLMYISASSLKTGHTFWSVSFFSNRVVSSKRIELSTHWSCLVMRLLSMCSFCVCMRVVFKQDVLIFLQGTCVRLQEFCFRHQPHTDVM